MKTSRLPALLLAGALASPALHAQSFLESLVRSTAVDAARKAVTDKATAAPAPKPAAAPAAQGEAAGAAAPAAAATPPQQPGCKRVRGTPMPPLGPRPDSYQPEELWPDEACNIFRFNDFTFKAAKEKKEAFDEAARVPCSGCEGGRSYDSWAHFFLYTGGDYQKKFQEALMALTVGGKGIDWKGQKFNGTVTLVGTEPIGEFACRQYHWTLKDAKKNVVAERPGLYCEYQAPFAGSKRWHEVI